MSKPNCLFFVDFMSSEDEIPKLNKFLKTIKNINYKVTDNPEEARQVEGYTHIFLDFGGLMQPGNSLFSCFCNLWDKIIDENPDKWFILMSVMGKEFFQDDMFNLDYPNVLSIRGFSKLKEDLELLLKKYK